MSERDEHAGERAILILYATETGNSLDAAERIAREVRRWHFHTRLASTDAYPLEDLISEPCVIFVLSTTGSGSEPRPMIKLWKLLLRGDLLSDLFDETCFTVFGLGDSAYERFCWASKKLVRRMESLGAKEFHPSRHADEQERLGFDSDLGPWIAGLIETLNTRHPLPSGLEVLPQNQLPPPRVSIQAVSSNKGPAGVILPQEPETEYHNALLKISRRVTAPDWYQDVRHLEFGFDHPIQYRPGDVAILHPCAQEGDVHALLERFDWLDAADEELKITSLSLDQPVPEYVTSRTVTLRELFRNTLDLTAVPRKSCFELLRHFTDDSTEKEKFVEFCSPEGQDEMYEYVQRPRRTILEVLLDFRHAKVPKEYIFDLFPLMRPREFSIASSVKKHPKAIQLCIAIVKYKTKLKHARKGLCTTWLAGLEPSMDRKFRVGIHRGLLSLPPTLETPVVCIGPGTGIAPMRCMIQERIVDGAHSNTLYFGCRSAAKDYYYSDEWERHAQGGKLLFRVAFSRDQDKKVYVQDLIEEDSVRIWELVGVKGAWVYISGSSNKMPLGVKGAIKNAAIKEGGMAEEDANKWIAKLELEGRLVEECWS